MLTRLRLWWRRHQGAQRFGHGRRTLAHWEFEAVAQGLREGRSDSAISRHTGLNRRTVARLRMEGDSRGSLTEDLGGRGQQRSLRPRHARAAAVSGGSARPRLPLSIAVTPMTAMEAFRYRVLEQVLLAALAYARRHDPERLVRWGERALRSLWPDRGDVLQQAAADVAANDDHFRRRLAEVELQRRTPKPAPQAKQPTLPPSAVIERQLQAVLQKNERQQTATLKAVMGPVTAAVGRGGALTTLLSQLGGPEPAVPAAKGSKVKAPTLLGVFSAVQTALLVEDPMGSASAAGTWACVTRQLEARSVRQRIQTRALLTYGSRLTAAEVTALFQELVEHPDWTALATALIAAPEHFVPVQERLRSLLEQPPAAADPSPRPVAGSGTAPTDDRPEESTGNCSPLP